MRDLKKRLIRSNTRGIYTGDDDDQWISDFPEIQRIADEIEKKRIKLGKDSGFERLYPRAAKLYFGGMAKHMSELRNVLRPGAQLAYVVGDQASYLRVMIRTGQILGEIAQKLGGDVLYSFRYRTLLPKSITSKTPKGYEWIIRPAGKGKYKFVITRQSAFSPSNTLVETKIPDATPGVIVSYSLNDEQSLLAKLRYNRLIDIFTGLTCYSLQNHLRTTLEGGSQIETDEIYIGLDKRGAHFVIPVQAKGRRDKIGVVQIEQDLEMCAAKFPGLVCRAVAAQYIDENFIALFEFEPTMEGIKVSSESITDSSNRMSYLLRKYKIIPFGMNDTFVYWLILPQPDHQSRQPRRSEQQ